MSMVVAVSSGDLGFWQPRCVSLCEIVIAEVADDFTPCRVVYIYMQDAKSPK